MNAYGAYYYELVRLYAPIFGVVFGAMLAGYAVGWYDGKQACKEEMMKKFRKYLAKHK